MAMSPLRPDRPVDQGCWSCGSKGCCGLYDRDDFRPALRQTPKPQHPCSDPDEPVQLRPLEEAVRKRPSVYAAPASAPAMACPFSRRSGEEDLKPLLLEDLAEAAVVNFRHSNEAPELPTGSLGIGSDESFRRRRKSCDEDEDEDEDEDSDEPFTALMSRVMSAHPDKCVLMEKMATRRMSRSDDVANPDVMSMVTFADPIADFLYFCDNENVLLARFALDAIYTQTAYARPSVYSEAAAPKRARKGTEMITDVKGPNVMVSNVCAPTPGGRTTRSYAVAGKNGPMQLVAVVMIDDIEEHGLWMPLHRPARATEYDLKKLIKIRRKLLGSFSIQTTLSVVSLIVASLGGMTVSDDHCNTKPVTWQAWFAVQAVFSATTLLGHLLLWRAFRLVYNRNVLRANIHDAHGDEEKANEEREKGNERAQQGVRLMRHVGHFGWFATIFGVSWFILALYMSLISTGNMGRCKGGLIWFWAVFTVQVALALVNVCRHTTMRRKDLIAQKMDKRVSEHGKTMRNSRWSAVGG